MLNVCFDSSAAGMLAMTMPGHAEHVVCLAFALSAGDIAAPLEEGGPRWQLLHRWFSFSAAHQKDSDTILSSHWHHCTEDLARLCARAAEEPVRIYVDQTPDAACGLLFVAHLLSEAGCLAVSAVPLPFYQERPDGTLVHFWSWNEVSPEEHAALSREEQPLSPSMLRMLSARWQQLQAERAPLRIVLNGRVTSVGEDFYDRFLLDLLQEGPCTTGELIGRMLGHLELSISDGLLSERIQALIDRGTIRIIKEHPVFPSRVVALRMHL